MEVEKRMDAIDDRLENIDDSLDELNDGLLALIEIQESSLKYQNMVLQRQDKCLKVLSEIRLWVMIIGIITGISFVSVLISLIFLISKLF